MYPFYISKHILGVNLYLSAYRMDVINIEVKLSMNLFHRMNCLVDRISRMNSMKLTSLIPKVGNLSWCCSK